MTEEIKKKLAELTDQEIEKAAGGTDPVLSVQIVCENCNQVYSINVRDGHTETTPCPNCGYYPGQTHII